MDNLLVVDDDEDVLDVLKSILKGGGYTVVTANCGLPALDILDTGQPLDLMLTDVIMPGLSGFSLARMAKMRRPSLKILYLSGGGESFEIARDQGLRLGKLLAKPILSADLMREVAHALASECRTAA